MKPEFTQIDINFYGMNINDIYNSKSIIKTFDCLIKQDYETLKSTKDLGPYKNVILQTGLMLACYIGDVKGVESLLYEIGNVDLNDNNALFYAMNSLNPNDEIIKMISKYEWYEI